MVKEGVLPHRLPDQLYNYPDKASCDLRLRNPNQLILIRSHNASIRFSHDEDRLIKCNVFDVAMWPGHAVRVVV